MNDENPYESPTATNDVKDELKSKKFPTMLKVALGFVAMCGCCYALPVLMAGYDMWNLRRLISAGNGVTEYSSLCGRFGLPTAWIGCLFGVIGTVLAVISRIAQLRSRKKSSISTFDLKANE